MPKLSLSLEDLVEEVLSKNPGKILEYHAGVQASFEFLVNEVLRLSGGRADPAKVRALLLSKLLR